MKDTGYARKIDSNGRIIIPSKLREQLSIAVGEIFKFYIHQEQGKLYLCIECPEKEKENEINFAIEVLKRNGFSIEKREME